MTRLQHILIVCFASFILFPSCNKVSPAYYRNNMIGHWIVDTHDDVLLNEQDFAVLSFDAKNNMICRAVKTDAHGNRIWSDNSLLYDIYCCDFSIYGEYDGLFGHVVPVRTRQEYDFVVAQDSLVKVECTSYTVNGSAVTPEYRTMTLRRIPNTFDKADSLYGVWQFNTHNGQSFDRYRLQFQQGGSLRFYRKNTDGSWTVTGEEDVYNRYSDFLTLTLFGNPVFGDPALWNVACFSIRSLSPSAGDLVLVNGDDVYTLSYISAN